MDQNYGNMNWQMQGNGGRNSKQKNDNTGFGIASLVLGIVSLLLFCTCFNWITGILAIVFGILQLVQNKQKGLAIGGIITAGVSMLFTIVLYVSMMIGEADGNNLKYYDYKNGYYDDYYNNTDDAWDTVKAVDTAFVNDIVWERET